MKQNTKILTLGVLLLFATTLSLSAQKCKYDYNKKDPITDEVIKGIGFNIETKRELVGELYKSKIGFNKVGERYYVNVELMYTGNLRESIKKNDPCIIKLSNGEAVTIYPQSDFLPSASTNGYGVYTQYKAKYDIDAASLQKISEFTPIFFRLSIESKTYDKELDSKDKQKFTNAARCILQ